MREYERSEYGLQTETKSELAYLSMATMTSLLAYCRAGSRANGVQVEA